jgi:hypothetical protein
MAASQEVFGPVRDFSFLFAKFITPCGSSLSRVGAAGRAGAFGAGSYALCPGWAPACASAGRFDGRHQLDRCQSTGELNVILPEDVSDGCHQVVIVFSQFFQLLDQFQKSCLMGVILASSIAFRVTRVCFMARSSVNSFPCHKF